MLTYPPPRHRAPVLASVAPHRRVATVSVVLGLAGVLVGLVPAGFFVALTCGILAVVLGGLALRYGPARAGMVLGTLALAAGTWGAVVMNLA